MKIASGLRLWVMAAAAWAVISACGNGPSDPEPNTGPFDTSAGAQTFETSVPVTDTGGPDPDTGGGGPSVELPQLPIGGNADASTDPAHPANQCVNVNWIADQEGAQIPAGVEVAVTGFVFGPDIFAVSDVGCSGANPSCVGYTFTTSDQVCDLAIEPLGVPADPAGETPSVSATGEVRCGEVAAAECTAFLEAVAAEQNVAIDLNFPAVEDTTVIDDTTDSETTTDGADGETTDTATTTSESSS